jgi:hypothetical protein
MRKRSRIIFAMMVTACLGGIVWVVLWHAEPEPVYQGKPLSYWLAQYGHSYRYVTNAQQMIDANLPMDTALRYIGTNAVPTLLRMLRAKDSPLTVKLMDLAQKQTLVKIHYVPAALRNSQAAWAFAALNGMDNSTVPEVINIYEERISVASQNCAVRSLATFTGRNELRIPVFIKALQDTNFGGQIYAFYGLARMGKDARPAVPALVQALSDTHSIVRDTAAAVLREIDPEAAAKAGVK